MTLILSISCDGTWGEGAGLLACRATLPFHRELPCHLDVLRAKATAAGWVLTDVADLCPAHARLRDEWLEALSAVPMPEG